MNPPPRARPVAPPPPGTSPFGAGPVPAPRVGLLRVPRPPPSVLLLARPGGEGEELFADLLEREDLCLLRVANAAAANRAIEEMPVALVVACPEMPVSAIDAVVAHLRRRRSATPVLAVRARRAQEPAGWSEQGVAVLRLPLLKGVLSRSIDVVLGMRAHEPVKRRK